MRLPAKSATYEERARYGRYVARRLRRAKLTQMTQDVTKASLDLRAAGRAWEDTEDAIQDAIADRDAIDDSLDDAAKDARAALAGRSADADQNPPYTLIFDKGAAYYTAAPLDEEEKRYSEFKGKLADHLPPGDEVLMKTVPLIQAGLDDFPVAVKELNAARTAQALAATKLAAATDSWTKLMEKTYGALVGLVGKVKAERFFPRVRTKAKKDDEGGGDPKK